jgi:hypothetical protein
MVDQNFWHGMFDQNFWHGMFDQNFWHDMFVQSDRKFWNNKPFYVVKVI